MAESLDFFAKMRTEDMDGVSIPSQRRHCMHFEQWRTRPGCSASIIFQPPTPGKTSLSWRWPRRLLAPPKGPDRTGRLW